MAKEGVVEVAVEGKRADLSRSHEPVSVDQEASPVCETLERLGREVTAQDRSDMHPFDAPQHTLRLVAVTPGLSERLDAHLASAVVVVTEREGCRLARSRERHRKAECGELPEVLPLFRLTAFRGHDRFLMERSQGPRRVPRPAADPRGTAGDEVTRERADDGERSHDRQL